MVGSEVASPGSPSSLLFVMVAVLSVSGCATVPTTQEAAASGPTYTSDIVTKCAVNLDTARRCAAYVEGRFEAASLTYSRIEIGSAAVNAVAGIVGVTYAKSASDRSQAIEDLAVSVAGLGLFRSIVNPRERRAILERGIDTLGCLVQAADAADRASRSTNVDSGAASWMAARTTAKSSTDLDVLVAPKSKREDLEYPSSQLKGLATGLVGVYASVLDQSATVAELRISNTTSAKASEENAPLMLATGVQQVIGTTRRALASLSSASAAQDLVAIQRTTVESLLGSLSRGIEAKNKEVAALRALQPAKIAAESAFLAAFGADGPSALSSGRAALTLDGQRFLLNETPEQAASEKQVQDVYRECAAPSNSR